MTSPKRIEFVDLVKGFCMFFVISFHCHLTISPWFHNTIRTMYLPAFFFCSALFFKADQPFMQFCVRKINLLLVPWAFFLMVCFCGYAAIYVMGEIFPQLGINWVSIIGGYSPYGFIKFPANLPSWYLWCIFFAFMDYYTVCRLGQHRLFVKVLATIVLAILGYSFEGYDLMMRLRAESVIMMFFYDFHFFTALEMLPFMLLGDELRKRGLLTFNFRSPLGFAIIALSIPVWVIMSRHTEVSLYGHEWTLLAYLPAFAGTFAIFALMAVVGRLPLLGYLGRYSLTVLCTHYMVYLVLDNFIHNEWWLFAAVLLLTIVTVKFFTTYFPLFTGQKNLFSLSRSITYNI